MFPNALKAVDLPRPGDREALAPRSRGPEPVVVALDGSSASEPAVAAAAVLAGNWKAPLRLLHVRNPVEDAAGLETCLVDNGRSLTVESRSSEYLKSLAEALRFEGHVVRWEAVAGTSIEASLRSYCDPEARALVMVRSRRSALSRFWKGGVTDRLMGQLSVPLLLVPEARDAAAVRLTADQGETAGYKRILVHLDGTEADDRVIENAAAIASRDAICHVVRILPLSTLHSHGRGALAQAAEVREKAWNELLRARNKFDELGFACRLQLVFDGQPTGRAIAAHARARRAQAIVLAARPTLLPRWLHRGVAEYVVRHTDVPVLIVPAHRDVDSYESKDRVELQLNEGPQDLSPKPAASRELRTASSMTRTGADLPRVADDLSRHARW